MLILNGNKPSGGYLEGVDFLNDSIPNGITIWNKGKAFANKYWQSTNLLSTTYFIFNDTLKLDAPISRMKTGLRIFYSQAVAFRYMESAENSSMGITPLQDGMESNSAYKAKLITDPVDSSVINKDDLLANKEITLMSFSFDDIPEGNISVKMINDNEIMFISHTLSRDKYTDTDIYNDNSTAYQFHTLQSNMGYGNGWIKIDSVVSC